MKIKLQKAGVVMYRKAKWKRVSEYYNKKTFDEFVNSHCKKKKREEKTFLELHISHDQNL